MAIFLYSGERDVERPVYGEYKRLEHAKWFQVIQVRTVKIFPSAMIFCTSLFGKCCKLCQLTVDLICTTSKKQSHQALSRHLSSQ